MFVTDASNLLPTKAGGRRRHDRRRHRRGRGAARAAATRHRQPGDRNDPRCPRQPGAVRHRSGRRVRLGDRRARDGRSDADRPPRRDDHVAAGGLDGRGRLRHGARRVGERGALRVGAQRRARRVPARPTSASTSPNFRVTGGTCRRGVIVPAGGGCTVYLVFNPTEPIVFAGALTVSELGDDPISVTASMRGVGGEPTLQANPPGLDLHSSVVNGIGDRRTLDVRNVSFLPTSIASIRLGGNNPDDFAVVGQSCTNRALNPDASCSVEVEFRPRASGRRSALVLLQTPTGEYTSAIVSGEASYAPTIAVASPSVAGRRRARHRRVGLPGEQRHRLALRRRHPSVRHRHHQRRAASSSSRSRSPSPRAPVNGC